MVGAYLESSAHLLCSLEIVVHVGTVKGKGGALCAELGALQSTHSALLLREELTMTIRDRKERGGGEQRVPVGIWGVCAWGKLLALCDQEGMGQGTSSRWDHQVEGPHLHGQKMPAYWSMG